MTIPGLGLLSSLFSATTPNTPATSGPIGGGDGESPLEVAFAAVLLGALVTEASEPAQPRSALLAFGAWGGGDPDPGEAPGEVSGEGSDGDSSSAAAETRGRGRLDTEQSTRGEAMPVVDTRPGSVSGFGGLVNAEGEPLDPTGEVERAAERGRSAEGPPSGPLASGGGSKPVNEGSGPSTAEAVPESAYVPAASLATRSRASTGPVESASARVGHAPLMDIRHTGALDGPADETAPSAGPTRMIPADRRVDEPSATLEVRTSAVAETRPTEPGDADPAADPESLVKNRDVSRLNPELRERLTRVVERMQLEYGHRVRVVEGYRTPQRQAHLFAQGRSRPGPVVTWTTESRHSQGRAVDLQVDGAWSDARAYARLQKVAGEEGLVTLGARDRGHVELPASRSSTSTPVAARPIDGWTAPKPESSSQPSSSMSSGMAPVAEVAAVAGRARAVRTAAAASPARVAIPGMRVGSSRATADGAPDTTLAGAPAAAERPSGQLASSSSEQASTETAPHGDRDDGGREARNGVRDRHAPATPTTLANLGASEPRTGSRRRAAVEPSLQGVERRSADATARLAELAADTGSWTRGPDRFAQELTALTGAGSETAERVERIQQLKDAAGLNGPGELRLDLDEREGLGARIRMALRGSSVAATIDIDDPVMARRLEARIGELHRALEGRGLEPATLGVRTPLPVVEASDPAALKGALDPPRATAGGDAQGMDTGARRERSTGDGDGKSRGWEESFDRSSQDPEREENRDR